MNSITYLFKNSIAKPNPQTVCMYSAFLLSHLVYTQAAFGYVSIGDGSGVSTSNIQTPNIRAASGRGANAIEIGGARFVGGESIAIGIKAYAGINKNQIYNVAIGGNAYANGDYNTVAGLDSRVVGNYTTSYGANATINGDNATAIGSFSTANASNALALGTSANASGVASMVLGAGQASAQNAIAFGNNAIASADDALVLGVGSHVSGQSSVGLGNLIHISGSHTYALGNNINAATDGSVVLGDSSSTTGSHAITNVTDVTVNGVTYAGFAGTVRDEGRFVSVGSVGDERKIINVAAGAVAPNSTDLINGSQLHSVMGAMDRNIKELRAGVASAVAIAGLGQAVIPGKNFFSIGGGYYKGETGYAASVSHLSDSGTVGINLAVASNSRNQFTVAVGVGFKW